MKTIYKYPLQITDEQTVTGKIDYMLTVKEQNGGLCLWAVVDDTLTERSISIRIVGTGHPFPDSNDCIHIETVVMPYGAFVWHIFEKFKELE